MNSYYKNALIASTVFASGIGGLFLNESLDKIVEVEQVFYSKEMLVPDHIYSTKKNNYLALSACASVFFLSLGYTLRNKNNFNKE